MRRSQPPSLPELAQVQVLRHYMRLSQMTLGFDLTPDASSGTCTMKYSPKLNELVARLPEITELHPLQDDETVQGILQVIHDFERIMCAISGMDAYSFQAASGELEPGSTVTGRVTRIADFGAFVEIAPGVEGLIHISELSHERVNKVSSVVKEDEVVTAKVLSVDSGKRRIGLSLKAAKAAEERDTFSRKEDPEVRRLKAMLGKKFGDNLKGGLG